MAAIIGIVILLFLVPFGLIIWLMVRIVKKKRSVTPQEQNNSLQEKIDQMKLKLTPWAEDQIPELSPYLSDSYVKGLSGTKKKGYFMNDKSENVLAFALHDKGAVEIDEIIIFSSTEQQYSIKSKRTTAAFRIGETVFGFADVNKGIYNAEKQKIGDFDIKRTVLRTIDPDHHYGFHFASGLKGHIVNFDNSIEDGYVLQNMYGDYAIIIDEGSPTAEELRMLLFLYVWFNASSIFHD
ncbi:hypothetical protein GYB29_13160 [bacterium]|nr:hypothetical protein [bacterium]